MNILKVYVSKTGKKLDTDNLTLNQNSYYNTLQLYTEEYYPEVVCTFKNSNGDLSPRCHMIFKSEDKELKQYKYEFPIPYQLTSFSIPLTSGKLETSFIMYKTEGNKLVYPTVANVNILVNKSNNTPVLDDTYNGTDVENLWKVIGELMLRTAPDGGDKQDRLIPGNYIEITPENVINVMPIDYSYITNKPIIPTAVSQLTNDLEFTHVAAASPLETSPKLLGINIDGFIYKLGTDLTLSENEVENATPVKNILYDGKNWFVGGITDAEKKDIQDQLNLKANISDVYDINTIDEKLLGKVNYDDIFTKLELNNKFNDKADKSTTYNKTEVNDLLNNKADVKNVYTINEMNSKLNLKVDNTYLTENYYNKKAIDDKLTSALVYKGSVATYNDLPKTHNKVGDFWNVLEDDANYAWDGKKWDKIGGTTKVDLSDYYTIEQVDAKDKVLSDSIATKLSSTTFTEYQATVTGLFSAVDDRFNSYYTSVTVDTLLGDKANKSDVYTISQIDTKLDTKQPVGDYPEKNDFKTINNKSIIGVGNIDTGTDVVPNPVLVGSEEYLLGLEVEGNKYKVGAENMIFSETAVEGAHQLRNINIGGDNWGIPESGGGGSEITVDSAMSLSSTNPVQNKVITERINEVENKVLNITVDVPNSTLVIN